MGSPSSSNGNNGDDNNISDGGMDEYARQMQELTPREGGGGQEVVLEASVVTEEPPIQMETFSTPPPPPPPQEVVVVSEEPPIQKMEIPPTPPPPPKPPSAQQAAESDTASSSSSSNQPISNVDARVLESILNEGKLDLSTEEEVKKLLEGPRLQEGEDANKKDEGDGKYSSKFVSAVSDNTFWNSLRAKAEELLESATIYIENRIERDSQTLAAVGLFTLDRIRRDIGRALPAAGRATRQLLLATNSSYAEKLVEMTDRRNTFALPSDRTLTDREMLRGSEDLYEELTTPADEIRQVTEAIRDILSGKDVQDSSYSARRGVRSFAPAGTSRLAERQRRAYRARKNTVLKREREGIDRKVGRAIGSVTDGAWELRREMQTDKGREAGYRSKGVRNALTQGAVQLLEAGREGARLLQSANEERRNKNLIGGDDAAEVVEVMGDKMPNFVDVSPLEEEEIIEEIIEEANLEYAPDGLLSPQSFMEEKRRLIASLESCLSSPSETWLTKEVVEQATELGITLDGTVLREVITSMVTLRDRMQNDINFIEEQRQQQGIDVLKIEYVQAELRQMKEMVDSLCAVAIAAAGDSAAVLLKQELEGFVLSDSLDDIIEIELERMEQLLAEKVAKREEQIRARKERQQQKRRRQMRYQEEAEAAAAARAEVVATEVIDSTVIDPTTEPKSARWNGGMYTEVEVVSSETMGSGRQYDNPIDDDQYYQGGSQVEVVSNTEYSEYKQRFKSAQSVDAVGYDDEVEAEENPATDFVLRALDVLFFVGEKLFLVLLPDLITGGAKVTSRYARATNRGRGSVGWKPLKNTKVKNIR